MCIYRDCPRGVPREAKMCLKPGFYSNARKVLHKKKYASKIKKCARNAINATKLRKQKTKLCKRKSRNWRKRSLRFTQRTQAPANRNGRSKQPIIASTSACVACVFRLRDARISRNARKRLRCVACVWNLNGNRVLGWLQKLMYRWR